MRLVQIPVLLAIMFITNISSAAVPLPKIKIAPAAVNLGTVKAGATSATRTFAVYNQGTADLTITSLDVSGKNAAEFNYATDCGILTPAASCTVNVTYTASLPYAMKTGILTVHSDDPKHSSSLVKLVAAVKPPKVNVNPKAVNFGKLASGLDSLEKIITVKNTGSSDLVINGVNVKGVNPSDFSSTNYCSNVASGASCTISLVFKPHTANTKSSALVEVLSNDPLKKISPVKLTGASPADLPTQNKMLSVNKFGMGTVTDSDGLLGCGANCLQQYPEGKTVTLTAAADDSWQLHHWSGCDTVNGAVCTVTLNENRNVYPTFNSIETKLQANVVQLDNATMALLKSQSGTTYVFDISATAVASLKPGDVIISTAGEGLARKVTSVNVLAGAAIYLDTTAASLQEIIQDGTIIDNQELSYDNIKSAVPLMEGVRLVPPVDNISREITVSLDSYLGGNNKFKVSGKTTFKVGTDFALHASLFEGIKQFRTAFKFNNDTDLTVGFGYYAPELIDVTKDLYEFTFAPIVAGPVVLVPTTKLIFKLEGEVQSAFEAGATYTAEATAGIQYLKSNGWSGIHEFSQNAAAKGTSWNGSAGIKASIVAESAVKIYSVAGPTLSFGPFVEAKASAVVGSKNECLDYGVYWGVNAKAGAKVEVIGFDLGKYEVNLFELKWPLVKGEQGACSDSEAPTIPKDLAVAAVSQSDITLAWSPATDNSYVDGYKIFRDDHEIADSPTNTFTDSFLTTNKTYCYTVAAYDKSRNLSGKSEMKCPKTKDVDRTAPTVPTNIAVTPYSTTALKIAWNEATDDTRVAGYTLYRDGVAINSIFDGLSTYDTTLKAGTQYCYTLKSFDEAGNVSEMSSSHCATTKTEGAWKFYLACQGQPYVIEKDLDLNEEITNNIQATGTAYDYNGTGMAYVVSGLYDSPSKVLDGNILFSFLNSSCVREDLFTADLSTGDSGDTVMNQVQVCGCTATIRFKKADITMLTHSSPKSNNFSGFSFK